MLICIFARNGDPANALTFLISGKKMRLKVPPKRSVSTARSRNKSGSELQQTVGPATPPCTAALWIRSLSKHDRETITFFLNWFQEKLISGSAQAFSDTY